MRVFASDTIKKMMGRFGIPEDEPIENRIITRSLETAQTKIEGFHFDSRKHVLEYDDVLNHQRKIIYERRRAALVGGTEAVDEYLETLASSRSLEGRNEVGCGGGDFANVVEVKKQQLGENFYPVARRLILQSIDLFWVDHLEVMDYLRSSVNLRAYGQRDPLVEYKREGLRMFKEMEEGIANQVIGVLPLLGLPAPARAARAGRQAGWNVAEEKRAELREVHEDARIVGASNTPPPQAFLKTPKKTVGRNEPCPCGSGKKYKRCHGK